MKTLQKIETWLPIFSGFYNTIWEYDYRQAIDDINQERESKNLCKIEYDNLKIDYSNYEFEIVLQLIEIIKNELSDYIENIEFQSIQSPKYYNFKNDSVDILVIPKIENIKKFIYDNKEKFKEYLKNKYTGCDGYIPYYSNSFDDWENNTNNFTNWDVNGHYLGSILQFIAEILEIKEINLYYNIEIDTLAYIENLKELFTMPICNQCNKIIKDIDILKDIEKYKKIMGKYPSKILCNECIENC